MRENSSSRFSSGFPGRWVHLDRFGGGSSAPRANPDDPDHPDGMLKLGGRSRQAVVGRAGTAQACHWWLRGYTHARWYNRCRRSMSLQPHRQQDLARWVKGADAMSQYFPFGRVESIAAPVVAAAGMDLEGISSRRSGRREKLSVVVDADGGVTSDPLPNYRPPCLLHWMNSYDRCVLVCLGSNQPRCRPTFAVAAALAPGEGSTGCRRARRWWVDDRSGTS